MWPRAPTAGVQLHAELRRHEPQQLQRRLTLAPETALLGRGLKSHAADREALPPLLGATQPPAIQQTALRSLRALNAPDLSTQLLTGWRSYSPAMRATVIDALLSNDTATTALLGALEKNTLPAGQISPAHQQRLTTHQQPALAPRAASL